MLTRILGGRNNRDEVCPDYGAKSSQPGRGVGEML